MQADAVKTPDAERREPLLVLEPAELALDSGAATVEVPQRFVSRGISGWRRQP
jgi:hypothetical protein